MLCFQCLWGMFNHCFCGRGWRLDHFGSRCGSGCSSGSFSCLATTTHFTWVVRRTAIFGQGANGSRFNHRRCDFGNHWRFNHGCRLDRWGWFGNHFGNRCRRFFYHGGRCWRFNRCSGFGRPLEGGLFFANFTHCRGSFFDSRGFNSGFNHWLSFNYGCRLNSSHFHFGLGFANRRNFHFRNHWGFDRGGCFDDRGFNRRGFSNWRFNNRRFNNGNLNYRGSTGYGRDYRQALHLKWGEVDVEDACAVVSYLAGQGLIDGEKAFIRGGSAGGYTTLCALAFKDVFRGGASLYGVSDPIALTRSTHKFEGDYLDWLIGDPVLDAERYAARTPLLHAGQIRVPVIFFQGELDAVVVPQQTRDMLKALEDNGIPAKAYYYPQERHGFRTASNQAHALEREWQFYSELLNP